MATFSEQPAHARGMRVRLPEMWASLAIVSMWLVVLIDALFGPDFVSTSGGGNMTKIPSAIVLGLFAYLATVVVAKAGFGRPPRD